MATKSDRSTKWLRIIPEIAKKWLKTNFPNQRRLSNAKVEKYAKMMRDGDWQENGEPFIFSNTGKLVNGQHRLHAMILAGYKGWVVVVRGVPEESFHTIDSGPARGMKDVFSIDGEDHPYLLAPALNHHHHYTSQQKRNGGSLSKPESFRYLEENPQLRESTAFVAEFEGQRWLPRAPAVALHAIFSELDGEEAGDFMTRLFTGSDVEVDDPIHLCRYVLMDLKGGNARNRMNYILRAWNAVRTGEVPRSLRLPNQNSDLAYIVAV